MTKEIKASLFIGDLRNLGDAFLALTEARYLINQGFQVCVMPYEKASESIYTEFLNEHITVSSIRRTPLSTLWKSFNSHVIIGGGHAIRNNLSIGWLLFVIFTSLFNRIAGKQVRLVGAGVSKIQSQKKYTLVKTLINICHSTYSRDEKSYSMVKSIANMNYKDHFQSTDMAFLIGSKFFNPNPTSKTCIIAPAYDSSEGRNGDVDEIISTIKTLFSQKIINNIVLIPHDTLHDLDCCRLLEAKMVKLYPECAINTISTCTLNELLDLYMDSNYVITGRLHSLIIGALMGRNVIFTEASKDKLAPFASIFNYTSSDKINFEHSIINSNNHQTSLESLQEKAKIALSKLV